MSSLTTKKAISFTLKELLLEKPLSKITVNDITERCDINRQTFYYHFESITDLVEWTCLEDADKVLKALEIYKEICKVITMYRKCRRSIRNDEFLNYMGIEIKNDEEYSFTMDKFLFINTSDILLLNAYANITDGSFQKYNLIKVINICKDIISDIPKISPSSATKNSNIFEKVQELCRKQKEM